MLNLNETERGNTWLCNDDQHVLVIRLDEQEWLFTTIFPDNYPGANVWVCHNKTTEDIADVLCKEYAGFFVRKWNLSGSATVDENGCLLDFSEEG